jgi:hypothetical protein
MIKASLSPRGRRLVARSPRIVHERVPMLDLSADAKLRRWGTVTFGPPPHGPASLGSMPGPSLWSVLGVTAQPMMDAR